MIRDCLAGLVGVVVLALPLAGQQADPLEAKVRALSHPKYAEREKAARELVAVGEPALKALKAVQTSTDEELRSRAAAVVEKIERASRSQRLLVAPTLNLKFDNVPLDKAVVELGQKTGLRFVVDGAKIKDVKRPITLNTGDLPFWESVQAFCQAAGLTENDGPSSIAPSPDSRARSRGLIDISGSYRVSGQIASPAIRLVDGPPNAPAATSHAFRVRALPANFAANKHDDTKGEVTFHLDIDAVPTMNVVEVLGIEVRKAIADDRRALATAYPSKASLDGYYGNDMQVLVAQQLVILADDLATVDPNGTPGTHYAVTLMTGGSRPKRLAELHGIVVARIMAPPEPLLTVTDIFGKGKGQTVRAEGMTCEILPQRTQVEQADQPPRIATQSPRAFQPESAPSNGSTESFVVRIVSIADATSDVLNVPVQMKGRVQQFIRINRGGARSFALPEFQVRTDKGGTLLRVINTRVIASSFNGDQMSQDVRVMIERPNSGVDGISLTLTGRRPAIVEMPFVLKNVPLP